MDAEGLGSAAGDEREFNRAAEDHRRDLLGYCYRMTGSLAEAEDAVQDTFLRAWKGWSGFEGRASTSTWLRSIATRACLDALENRASRALPLALGESSEPGSPMVPIEAAAWIDPAPDAWLSIPQTPEARYTWRESVALAFLVALQRLAPRQRAVLLMRDVLGMSASEVAEALDTSVASINSALQRARETLEADRSPEIPLPSPETGKLLKRYVAAWEQADASMLLELLREDSVLSMPPFAAWFRGPAAIIASMSGMVLPPEARGRFRLIATEANGLPAFGCYAREGADGFHPMAIHVVRPSGDKLAEIIAFLNPGLFRPFALPPRP